MNFNLYLLENINRYLFPLFYYGDNSIRHVVYCPVTFKFLLLFNYADDMLIDYSTKKFLNNYGQLYCYTFKNDFTEEFFYDNSKKFLKRCKPFKIQKDYLNFLNSKTRL